MLSIQDISMRFDLPDGSSVNALSNVSLNVAAGEIVSVLGPSGCGKTTLLRIMAGLERPTSGEVTLDGVPIERPGPQRGMVFQEYSLFPWRTILDNVAFGLELKGVSKEERYEKARRYITAVGLAGFENSYPHELSGGMKQRVAIVRALVNNPKALFMDEPFGALDAQTRNVMQAELLRIWQEQQKTVVFVTHSVDEAIYLADRVVIMSARPGQISEIIKIEIPRPRVRTSSEVNKYREKVLYVLKSLRKE